MTETEWLACPNIWRMIELLRAQGTPPRKVRLFACACCRRLWELLPDESTRSAVVMAERYADAVVSRKEYMEVRAAAETLARSLRTKWSPERSAAWAAVWIAAGNSGWIRTVQTAFSALTRTAAEHAWNAAEPNGGFDAAYAAGEVAQRETSLAEQQRLAELLRHIFGNPFRPYPKPASWHALVTDLAQQLYAGADVRLVLHDALLDVGHAELAEHFRQEERHPKGCWVVDLLTGRA